MRIIFLIIIYQLWICCSAQVGNIQSGLKTAKPYDTIFLKNDYKLILATTDELRILRLLGRGTDTIIISKNIKAPERYLGWLRADFEEYFVIYFGEDGYLPGASIFRKESGKLIATGVCVDIDTINHMVYYITPEGIRSLELFQAKTGKTESFVPPHVPCLWWIDCIVSRKLTDEELTIVYVGYHNKRETKVYTRKKD